MTTIDFILSATLCGVFAAVFHMVLIAPGHILSKPRQLIEGFVGFLARVTNYGRSYEIASWLTKSLVDCSWCLAGQVAAAHYWYAGCRDPFGAALYITASIMASAIAVKALQSVKG